MQCESFNHTTNAIAFAKVHKNCANRKQSAKNLFLSTMLRCRLSYAKIFHRYNRDITELQQ